MYKRQGYDLTLGSGSFIDGFEDQIIGHNVGDTFDVTVTFPDGYGDSTDAEGKMCIRDRFVVARMLRDQLHRAAAVFRVGGVGVQKGRIVCLLYTSRCV